MPALIWHQVTRPRVASALPSSFAKVHFTYGKMHDLTHQPNILHLNKPVWPLPHQDRSSPSAQRGLAPLRPVTPLGLLSPRVLPALWARGARGHRATCPPSVSIALQDSPRHEGMGSSFLCTGWYSVKTQTAVCIHHLPMDTWVISILFHQ